MSIDLSKLSPAPWEVFGGKDAIGYPDHVGEDEFWCRSLAAGFDTTRMNRNHAEFIALARSAFDVMMRRDWYPRRWTAGQQSFGVWSPGWLCPELTNQRWPDPFTALVEADRWYKEHVEGQPR